MSRRAALVATAAAICCGVLVGGYPLLLSGSGLIIAMALLGLGSVTLGVLRGFLTVSIVGIAILVAEYLMALFISGSSFDFLSAGFAVILLLLIELVDLAEAWRYEAPLRTVLLERLRYLVTVVAVGAVVAWLAAIAGTIVNSSLLLLVLGALGGIGAVALPLYLAGEVLASDQDDR